jgi:hypothetical protein
VRRWQANAASKALWLHGHVLIKRWPRICAVNGCSLARGRFRRGTAGTLVGWRVGHSRQRWPSNITLTKNNVAARRWSLWHGNPFGMRLGLMQIDLVPCWSPFPMSMEMVSPGVRCW